MLHAAVSEGDTASLAVPVCWELIPNVLHVIHWVADHDLAVIDALLVFVHEAEYLRRGRIDEL